MIVDDNEMNQLIMERMLLTLELLQNNRIGIIKAWNGQEAVDLVIKSQHNVRLIFMDSEMPVMDGYQASEIIRLTNPDTHIIGMSGHSGDQYSRMCRAAGMTGNVTKPINIKEIQSIVQEKFAYMN